MQRRLVSHSLSWSTGLPTHAWQQLRLQAGQLPDCPQWEQAPQLPAPEVSAPSPEDVLIALAPFAETVRAEVRRRNLDAAWTALMELAERYAAGRSLSSYTGPRRPSKVVVKPPEPIAKAEEAPEEMAFRKARTRVHRIQHLLVWLHKGQGALPAAKAVLSSLRSAEGASSKYLHAFRAASRPADWERLLVLAQEDLQAEACCAKAEAGWLAYLV